MSIKKTITGDYTQPGTAPTGKTSAQAEFERNEILRKKSEEIYNERRFDQYNNRLEQAGLPTIPLADYLARKHGLNKAIKQSIAARHTIPAIQPEHRDKVVLFTR